MWRMTNGQVIVVTGASAGVGRAVVREFARHGAKIGLLARGGKGQEGLDGAKRDAEELEHFNIYRTHTRTIQTILLRLER
jgi:NAD(P)-dependent dehydrogenase (short-subunit alcohol dehydrogenase family)